MKQLIILAAVLLSFLSLTLVRYVTKTEKQEVLQVKLTEVSKQCTDYLFNECVSSHIVKTFSVKNVHSKDIKAVSFRVQYLDILNNVKGEQLFTATSKTIASGYSSVMFFASYYSEYSDLDYFMLNSDVENIATKVTVENVIFTDGTTINK